MQNKFLAKVAAFGFVVSLLCSGCGSGVTLIAMISPTINQVSPQVVTAGTPNVTVTVQGANFQSQAALTVNGAAVPTTVVNSTTLAAKISGSTLAQPAVAQLQVRNNDGSASNQVPLTVTSAPDNGNSLAITTADLPGGQAEVGYTETFTATGGTSPYTWAVSSGTLPAGLTLSSAGVLSGTPTASGSFTFSITVTDSHMLTKTIAFSLLVSAATSAQALRVTSTTMPAAQVGATYSATLSASGGTPSYIWSISSGSLPAGLSLSSAGAISGSPTTAGTSTFTVAVKDSLARTASAQESITVSAAGLSISTTSLAAAKNGSSYSATLSATGGTPSYTWSISSGSLPAGLSLSSGGVISGTPTGTGTSTFTVSVKDSGSQTATAQESIAVSAAALAITTTSLGAAKNASPYSATLSATGGTPSYTWSISSGSLPAGLSLSSGGVISGTPKSTGTWSFTVAVKDSGSQTATAQESIAVSVAGLSISTTVLTAATTGSSYKMTLTANGGTPSYTWSISSGSLPAGLSLLSGGVISGTPTSAGTSTFTVAVKDSGSLTATAQESITVSVPVLAIATTSLAGATNGSSYSSTLSATGGTPGYAWSISSGSLPAGLTLSSGGVISGTPTSIGTSTFTVAVKDSGSPVQTVSSQESIAVSPAGLTITTTSLAAGTNGSSYSSTLGATGGTPGFTWSISSGSLPAGLTLSSGGVISGTPTATGTAKFTVAVKDSGSPTQIAAAQESITVGAAASKLTITSTSLGAAQTGSSYSTALNATGGAPSYTWSISSGSLPAGLSLSSGGVISGTPTATGDASFTVTVTDNSSPTQTASMQASLAVALPQLAVTTTSLSYGTTGANYSATVNASGGSPAYTWTVASGSLPAGLSISSAGVISGTPTATGTSSFTVSVSDSESPTQTATAQESITISAAATPGSAQIYVYPQAPIAPRGSYQSVTAIVTGVNDKTVTWTSDGGTIVGTNPCVVNEPCTAALYATNPGTYHLTATSNANHSVLASSTITITASPVQRTDHPRFLMTSDMVTALQAKATSNNTSYQAIKAMATNYYNYFGTIWTYSTWNGSACTGGSGPSSDQSANYTEAGAWWMTLVSLLDPNAATRNQFGCAARDVFIADAQYVISGEINVAGNRAGNSGEYWAFIPDYLLGGGYLSAADQTTIRQYLYALEKDEIVGIYGETATIGSYNTPVQFGASDELSAANMRGMGNNYTQARILLMSAAALTFNDNTTDDPALANTCNATRYQVCPDGTAGSLHAYWTFVTGGMLYKDWADMEDPSVFKEAYGLSSTPMCTTLWGESISCLGAGRGGESNEGTSYGNSLGSLRRAMNAIHTAGYDDPVLYGPEMSIGTMSYWDLRYVADFTLLTGLSGSAADSRWNYLTNGDSLNYYAYPSNYMTESAMLSGDSSIGRTDRAGALEWMVMNTAYGMATGQAGNCHFYCGINGELTNDYASAVALDLFLSLPAGDPTTNNPPADPRASLPTDWYNASNQHLVTRTGGWTTGANTIFSYYCTNTQIDHEHQFCGGFDVYSNGEYITKGRMEFDDYNDELSTVWNKNGLALVQYPGQTWCTASPWCSFNQAAVEGGQFWHGYQAGSATLHHAEVSDYVGAIADFTNAYNGGWGVFAKFNAVTAASRSLVYLRGSNQVVYYDRGATGSNAWDKATYIVSTGNPTFNGNTASWLTRSGNQKVFWTALEPGANAPQLDTTYTDGYAANDWEIYGRIKADAGSVASARFLSVLQWGSASFSGSSATRVVSSAGTNFEGALVGPSLVMFMQNWPGTLTTVTYPASGATTDYVSDLTPNTAYKISANGAPTTATADSAGVLKFTAAGTGDVTITAAP